MRANTYFIINDVVAIDSGFGLPKVKSFFIVKGTAIFDNNQCSEAEVCPSDKATPYFEYILKSESHPHKERVSDV